MELTKIHGCCGVYELHDLNELAPVDLLFGFLSEKEDNTPFVIFSDAVRDELGDAFDEPRGLELAKFIKDNKLGTLFATPERHNPNSGNNIILWVWEPDYDALTKWQVKYAKDHGIVLTDNNNTDEGW